jgi:squalene-associated FAD-dependent desaturase
VSVHIIGAGLAGLACAVRLSNRKIPVTIYEATDHAGGRCRSFFDNVLKRNIDNGNHLLLSGNRQAMAYMQAIGSLQSMPRPEQAAFPFLDLESGERWSVEANWKLRVPGSSLLDLLSAFKLAWAPKNSTVAETLNTSRTIYKRLWEPLSISILNTAPEEAAASLLWAVLKQTFGRGAQACLPCIPQYGLSQSLIDPALNLLQQRGANIHFNERLKSVSFKDGRAVALTFGHDHVSLEPEDTVIMALPIPAAGALLPGLSHPDQYRSIVNGHFVLPHTSRDINFLGLIGGVSQWLFVQRDVASVTVSAADQLSEKSSEEIAKTLWPEVLRALKLNDTPLPAYRIIKEKRATFAQTPEQLRLRPKTRTKWANVLLAGDWTDTGLPATIEGAVTSGHKAANTVR